MTALELLNKLQTYDIHLECVGDKLRVNAPVGVVTPELRSLLKEQKAALMALLSEGAPQASSEDQEHTSQASSEDQEHTSQASSEDQEHTSQAISGDQEHAEEIQAEDEIAVTCCVCGAMVECYSEQGEAYCEADWMRYLLPQPSRSMECPMPLTFVQEVNALAGQWDIAPPELQDDPYPGKLAHEGSLFLSRQNFSKESFMVSDPSIPRPLHPHPVANRRDRPISPKSDRNCALPILSVQSPHALLLDRLYDIQVADQVSQPP
jgi:hypothetical protein